MKATELNVGEEYAFTDSTADVDLLERRVTKVEVVKAASGGRVEVKLLEDGKTRVCTPWNEPDPVAGDVRRVKTRQIAMTWPRFERRLKNLADQQAEKDKEAQRKAARLSRIQARLDSIVPTHGPRDRYLARFVYSDEETIISTDQLERLLAAAEPN